jgi:hypothetical protein
LDFVPECLKFPGRRGASEKTLNQGALISSSKSSATNNFHKIIAFESAECAPREADQKANYCFTPYGFLRGRSQHLLSDDKK